jgi:3-oxoacyl-[acyl-carrier protein] reductase
MERRLQGKVAVITGAASGIGRATALRFGAEGAIVIAADIQGDGAEATAAAIRDTGGTAEAQACDVRDAAANQALVDHAVAARGQLDVLFCNAGGALPTPTHQISPAEYRDIIALNLDAVFYGIHAALPVMMRQGRGLILATSSGAGLNAVPGLAAYGAAKAGLITLIKSIAVDYGALGIRANAIAPGPMDTPGLRRWLETLPGGPDAFARQVPSGRLGTGEDIAAAAAFLATDEAFFVNGVVLPVDGAVAAKLASPKAG